MPLMPQARWKAAASSGLRMYCAHSGWSFSNFASHAFRFASMEMLTTYIQYSNMMSEFQADMQPGSPEEPGAFSQSPLEGSEGMNPNDFQKLMNTARQSDHQMTQDEFNQLFEALKQGKSAEEVARMEQMVQLARSFMK